MKKLIISSLLGVTLVLSGCSVHFGEKDTPQESKSEDNTNKTEPLTQEAQPQPTETEQSQQQPQEGTDKGQDAPSLDEVMAMVDEGKNVDGVVDQLGNTWSQNGDIAVSYTNPQGESYVASVTQDDGLNGTDFEPAFDGDEEGSIEYAEEPDQEVIDELQSEIDNAGLQTEMEAKQKELDDYINAFE